MPRRHTSGHLQDTFLAALDAYAAWDGTGEPPLVAREISLVEACGFVENCTDTLPATAIGTIAGILEVPVSKCIGCNYWAAARVLRAALTADGAQPGGGGGLLPNQGKKFAFRLLIGGKS